MLYIASVISVLLIFGIIYQYIITKSEQNKFSVPGKLIDIGGFKLHMIYNHCNSTGATVILESGSAASALDWAYVQPAVAEFANVLSYDRAGLGWSDESPYPRTSQQIVSELHDLLNAARITPPYILVGHSFGGLNMQLFANTYPNDIMAVVLVDSAHEELDKINAFKINSSRIFFRLVLKGTYYFGLVRLLGRWIKNPIFNVISSDDKNGYLANISANKYMRTIEQEGLIHMKESLDQLKYSESKLKEIPLIVITAGKQNMGFNDKDKATWSQLQRDLVSKSSQGSQLIAEQSGHMVPYTQPEIIITAIKSLIIKNLP